MSLWLRDQIRVVLCPDQLTAVRLRHGFRPHIVAKERIQVTASGDSWMPVTEALSLLLEQPGWQKATMVLILSNRFTRYQLLPASGTRLSDHEQLTRARHVYGQIYGERAAALTLRFDRSAAGSAVLVAGVEAAFIDALQKMMSTPALKLIAIQPYLMSLFNGYRRRISADPQWFVVQEDGLLCAALLHRGRWEQVRMQKTTQHWQPALQRLLSRARVTSELAEKANTVNLWTHSGDDPQLALSDSWSYQLLKPPAVTGLSPLHDAAFRSALPGVG